MRRSLLAALPLTLLLGAGLAFLFGLGRDPNHMESALVGQPVPGFVLADLNDPTRQVTAPAALPQGRPYLINVFASWCAPCQVEHPLLMQLAAREVPIIGIAWRDERADAQRFLARLGNPYALMLHDPDNVAGFELGLTGVPETFVVGSDGRIRYRHRQPLTEADLDGLILPLMEDPGGGQD